MPTPLRIQSCLLLLLALIVIQSIARGQQPTSATEPVASASSAPAKSDDSTQTSPEETLTFTKRVNLVVVPVVVRDKQGKAVGTLKREDFEVFDNGKLQSISTFSIENNPPAGEKARAGSAPDSLANDKPLIIPTHFFAYLFDDVHLGAGDLMQARAAAKKHLESGMAPDDRAGLFTTSGSVTQEFTNDKTLLSRAMDRMKPGFWHMGGRCPYMNYYLAQRIIDESGGSSVTPAWDAATLDTWNCMFNNAQYLEPQSRQFALDAARRELQVGHENTRRALLAIEAIVRHVAAMPGSRTLVLVSPGFQTGDDHIEQSTAITLATERNIVINALDARGLYTGLASADNENGPSTPEAARMEDPINRVALSLQANVMAELADGTGGKFFHDNNDLREGFDQLASPPEFIYVLAFRPEDLKQAGRYHRLKVKLAKSKGWSIQSRGGYYESAGAGDPQKLLSEELQQALFSREVMRALPIALSAGYSKKEGSSRELSVSTHVDLSGVRFRKVGSMNVDTLTLVCGLFDLNGNYVQGKKREVSLRLSDDVLKRSTDGMNIATTFDVEPGAYLIRVVVRDSGDELLSAVNGSGIIQ
jgi:VWFA-related protein